jgi:hypothetical protein
MTEAFHETQRMRSWWFMTLVALIIGLATWAFIQQIVIGEPWGTNPAPDWAVYVLVAFMAVIAWWLMSIRLVTSVDQTGVTYRLIPFHFRTRRIPWTKVAQAYIRQYRPLREYGGWGLRYGFKFGWAFNMRGNMGLQLVLAGGKKILIGTQRPDELRSYLGSIGKSNSS